LLERGYTDEQILSYFEKSYGQFVLLKPKFQGVNALVWLLPVLVLAIGFVLVVTKAKMLETAPASAAEASPRLLTTLTKIRIWRASARWWRNHGRIGSAPAG